MTEEQITELLEDVENYDLEFKAAQEETFSITTIMDYCAAISNGNGGHLLLGVNNRREIVGTKAYKSNWNTLANKINSQLQIRVLVHNVHTSKGRVLAFVIPRHNTATPVKTTKKSNYKYPVRDGESIVEMRPETHSEILAENDKDWSAEIAKGVKITDLDTSALEAYRAAWSAHTDGKKKTIPIKNMLSDLGLMDGAKVTNAALLLFGQPKVLSKVVPDAEIIFEWRNSPADIAYGERRNWRSGFMLIKDELWDTVNARNTVFRYQTGFTQREISAYDEDSIREAIVNAFTHRDYSIKGRSVVIKVNPESFYIENPGKLMPGVTLDNIIDKSVWRNRLLAESLEKINVMERSSQGVDKIFTHTIRDGKGIPQYSILPDPTVTLNIPATLKDQDFVNFLDKVSSTEQTPLHIKEIIELEKIRHGIKTQGSELHYTEKFLAMGIIERIGKGRGSRYILSRQYYKYTGDTGTHTRLSGLQRNVKRTLILEHLNKHAKITNAEIQRAMPDMDMEEIYRLLKSMKKDGLIEHKGSNRYGWWVTPQAKNTQLKLLKND